VTECESRTSPCYKRAKFPKGGRLLPDAELARGGRSGQAALRKIIFRTFACVMIG
jgi:hypothetical protein